MCFIWLAVGVICAFCFIWFRDDAFLTFSSLVRVPTEVFSTSGQFASAGVPVICVTAQDQQHEVEELEEMENILPVGLIGLLMTYTGWPLLLKFLKLSWKKKGKSPNNQFEFVSQKSRKISLLHVSSPPHCTLYLNRVDSLQVIYGPVSFLGRIVSWSYFQIW